MSRYLEFHALDSYPFSNLNRDDLGDPKKVEYGGVNRLRISSQCSKAAFRNSVLFKKHCADAKGVRSRLHGEDVVKHLVDRGVDERIAREVSRQVVSVVRGNGLAKIADKSKSVQSVETELIYLSPDEIEKMKFLADEIEMGKKKVDTDNKSQLKKLSASVLGKGNPSPDIALFGRMLANNDSFNVTAALNVSHGITTHKADFEIDYFSAIDDLNTGGGAAHIGEKNFGAGVYYNYFLVDMDQLIDNLNGEKELAREILKVLVRAIGKVSPSGMRSGAAHGTFASYILVQCLDANPNNLSSAFLKPMPTGGGDLMESSIHELRKKRDDYARSYGKYWVDALELRCGKPDAATMDDLVAFVAEAVERDRD